MNLQRQNHKNKPAKLAGPGNFMRNYGAGMVASTLLLMLVAELLCSPTFGQSAAACVGLDTTDCATQTASARVAVTAETTIGVRMGSAVDMDVVPSAEGKFVTGKTSLDVTTNNAEGYAVYMKTANAKSTLEHVGAVTGEIASIATNATGADFGKNTWGYTLLDGAAEVSEETTFQPVPAVDMGDPLRKTGSATTASYTLGFGAKIDATLPSGEYRNEVVVSVVANPRKVTSLMDATYMQDVNTEVCANTPTGTEVQLRDYRDGKRYYVARMAKDGRCWMTQNLAYTFVKGAVLTPADSDVTKNWTVPNDAKVIGEPGSGASVSTDMWVGDATIEGNGEGHANYGNYYAYGAATASSANSIGEGGVVVPDSICPKGWRLPTAGTGSEYEALIAGLSTASQVKAAPYYFVTGGVIRPLTGTIYEESVDDYAYYLSSVTVSGSNVRTFNIYGDTISANGSPSCSNGSLMRCIVK